MIQALILTSMAAVSVAPSPSGQMVVDGYLRTSAGVPVDGPTAVNLCLYADEVGGEPLFCETQGSLPVQKGFFQTRLGAGPSNPLTVAVFADHDELWFGVTVAGKPLPRTHVETDPFAFRALTCDVASSVAGFTPAATGTPGTVLVVGEDGKIPESVIPATVGKTYSAGAGLKLIGAVFSLDDASVTALATAACFDTPTELSVALAGWDQDAADDLTVGTMFSGVVTGTYDSLTLSCSGCLTQEMLAPEVAAQIYQGSESTLEAISNGTLTNNFGASFENTTGFPIPNSLTSQTTSITVPDMGTIASVSVNVSISHGDISELTLVLHAPDGTSVLLADSDNLSGIDLSATFPETLLPRQPLSLLHGRSTAGIWNLTVLDDKPSFTPEGSFLAWSLALEARSAASLASNATLVLRQHRITEVAEPIHGSDAATKAYADSASGLVELVAGEVIDTSGGPKAAYVRRADGRTLLARVGTDPWEILGVVGFALPGQQVGVGGTVAIRVAGVVPGFSGLEPARTYFLGTEYGAVQALPAGIAKPLGRAVTSTQLAIALVADQVTSAVLSPAGPVNWESRGSELCSGVTGYVYGPDSAMRHFTSGSFEAYYYGYQGSCTFYMKLSYQIDGGEPVIYAEKTVIEGPSELSGSMDLFVPPGHTVRFCGQVIQGSQACKYGVNSPSAYKNFRVTGREVRIASRFHRVEDVVWP